MCCGPHETLLSPAPLPSSSECAHLLICGAAAQRRGVDLQRFSVSTAMRVNKEARRARRDAPLDRRGRVRLLARIAVMPQQLGQIAQIDVPVAVEVAVFVGHAAGLAIVSQQLGQVGQIHVAVEVNVA